MSLSIDRVVIRSPSGSLVLSTQEFMALELPVRIRHVIAGEVSFYSGTQQVPQSEALRALQTQKVEQTQKLEQAPRESPRTTNSRARSTQADQPDPRAADDRDRAPQRHPQRHRDKPWR